jgi:hypothetical protein
MPLSIELGVGPQIRPLLSVHHAAVVRVFVGRSFLSRNTQ